MPDIPGREDFWNIGYPMLGILVYLAFPIIAAAVAYAFRRRISVWRLGKPMDEPSPWAGRLRRFLGGVFIDAVAHRKMARRELYPGIMHFSIFWGMLVLLVATTLSAIEFNALEYLDWEPPTAQYRLQFGFVWDVFGGALATVGIAMAAYRRYVRRPGRLNTFLDDGLVLSYLFLLVFTGFMIEGARIGATELNSGSDLYDPNAAAWSPVGWLFARGFQGIGLTPSAMEAAHQVIWWSHAGLFTVGGVYFLLRFKRLTHIIVSPANMLLRPTRPRGALAPMGDFDALETFGAKDLPDLTWWQLMNYDACTNCGRCQDQCPAWLSGKPLSPRKVMQDMRGFMEERAPVLLAMQSTGETAPSPDKPAAGGAVGYDELWACTSCAACVEACPVSINQLDTIVDLRRYLVLEESRLPDTAQEALMSLEQRGHPWRGTQLTRTSWMEGQNVPTIEDNPDADVLLWVGCAGALVERNVQVTRAAASILKKAGVSFAVLGERETCTGDPARRMGNEYLFQMLAMQNIETLQGVGPKTVLTTCPHCFNTMKNEYPQLGGHFNVQHYSEFIAGLIDSGRLQACATISGDGNTTYHDSCYLGRHNGVYDAPRNVARSIPGLKLVEMEPRCRQRGFCCGAGGGHMWIEESQGPRINHVRTDHFLETQADTVGVSCPFCLQMMVEGI
ncbi:MAG: (Fe-S)-binding protein, partial [Chloroflexota bacterium]